MGTNPLWWKFFFNLLFIPYKNWKSLPRKISGYTPASNIYLIWFRLIFFLNVKINFPHSLNSNFFSPRILTNFQLFFVSEDEEEKNFHNFLTNAFCLLCMRKYLMNEYNENAKWQQICIILFYVISGKKSFSHKIYTQERKIWNTVHNDEVARWIDKNLIMRIFFFSASIFPPILLCEARIWKVNIVRMLHAFSIHGYEWITEFVFWMSERNSFVFLEQGVFSGMCKYTESLLSTHT